MSTNTELTHQTNIASEHQDPDLTTKEEYRLLFRAALTDLGLVYAKLDLDFDNGGPKSLIAAIEGLKAQQNDLISVFDAFGIGSATRTLGTLLVNIENVKRRSECLSAIERSFFMVPGEPDEDFPSEELDDECLLSWGASPEAYVQQFKDNLHHVRPAK